MDDQLYERGIEIRRDMFGAEATDAAVAGADLSRDLQDLVTRYCFGEVWSREGLPRNVRSMLTIAILAALNRQEQLKVHVQGALANGVTRDEIREVLLHATIYCGVPAGVAAFGSAREVLGEREEA